LRPLSLLSSHCGQKWKTFVLGNALHFIVKACIAQNSAELAHFPLDSARFVADDELPAVIMARTLAIFFSYRL